MSFQKIMSAKRYPKGLDGRERDKSGKIREKRGDTLIATLRKEYGTHFARGYSPRATLFSVRKKTGKSLSELVRAK
jgi:hypothetical protein